MVECTYVEAFAIQSEIHLVTIVGPRHEVELASVHLEGPISEVQVAGSMKYRRYDPKNQAIFGQNAVTISVEFHPMSRTVALINLELRSNCKIVNFTCSISEHLESRLRGNPGLYDRDHHNPRSSILIYRQSTPETINYS